MMLNIPSTQPTVTRLLGRGRVQARLRDWAQPRNRDGAAAHVPDMRQIIAQMRLMSFQTWPS